MSTITFTVGDSYPNLFETLRYPGSVITDPGQGVSAIMIANGEETGQFTGAVTLSNPVSEGATESTVDWVFDVLEDDTIAEGVFNLCLRITHANGDQETVDIKCRAEVVECG